MSQWLLVDFFVLGVVLSSCFVFCCRCKRAPIPFAPAEHIEAVVASEGPSTPVRIPKSYDLLAKQELVLRETLSVA